MNKKQGWGQSVGQWIGDILIVSVIAFVIAVVVVGIYQDAVTPDVDRCKVAPEYCEWLQEYEENYYYYEPRG